jgi:hypothetical protein
MLSFHFTHQYFTLDVVFWSQSVNKSYILLHIHMHRVHEMNVHNREVKYVLLVDSRFIYSP